MSEHKEWLEEECKDKLKKLHTAHSELIKSFETYWTLVNQNELPDFEDISDHQKTVEAYLEAHSDFEDAENEYKSIN